MKPMSNTPSETAKRIFQEQNAQCAQAIFAAYGEQLGLGQLLTISLTPQLSSSC